MAGRLRLHRRNWSLHLFPERHILYIVSTDLFFYDIPAASVALENGGHQWCLEMDLRKDRMRALPAGR